MPFGPPPFPRFPLVSPSKPMVFPNESPPSQASVARCPSLAPAAVKPLGWQRCPWGSRDTAPWFGAHLAEGKAWGFRDGRLMMFDDRCTIYIYIYLSIYVYIYIMFIINTSCPFFPNWSHFSAAGVATFKTKKNGSAWLQNVAKPMVALTPSDSPVMFEYIFPIPPLKAGVCGPQNNSGSNML